MEVKKLWNRSYIFLILASTFSSFSFYMVITILVTYLTGPKVGVTTAVAGVIAGMFSITALIFRPLCGILTDRLNKVKLVCIATLMMAVGLFGYTVSASVPVIFAFRLLHGVGFAIHGTAIISLATDFIPKKRMGEGLGYFGLANVFSSAVAPGIGLMICSKLDEKSVFRISSVLILGCFFIVSTIRTSNSDTNKKVSRKLKFDDIIAVKALGYTLVATYFSFVNGIITTYLVSYAKVIGVANISLYFTVNAIFMFISRPISGKLMDKKGLSAVALPAILVTASSAFLLGRASMFGSSALVVILISAILRAVGQGAAQPSLQTASILKVGKEHSGVATSTFFLGGDVGQGIGPMIGGVIIGAFTSEIRGYRTMFDLCGVLLIIAFITLFIIQKREKKAK